MKSKAYVPTLPFRMRAVGGFTLVEILIVGAIIAIFAGLAVFSAQTLYQSNTRKAMYSEAKSLGTALAMARDDIGIFPRIHLLGSPTTLITYSNGNQQFILPAFDAYGFLGPAERVNSIVNNWRPPYTAVSEARKTFSQGQKLLVKMRLPEPENVNFPNVPGMGDISLVDWPSDIWGNPYMLYLVSSDPALVSQNNPLGLRLITNPGENPDYMCAVVSYGPNGVPGGNLELESGQLPAVGDAATAMNWRQQVLEPAMFYVRGDLLTGDEFTPGGQPIFTLKSMHPAVTGQASLRSSQFLNAFPRSISSASDNRAQIGMRDDGSDDIFWMF